jgi:molecular chaperone DnaK
MGHSFAEITNEAKEFLTVKGDNNTPRVDIDGRLYTTRIVSNDTSK